MPLLLPQDQELEELKQRVNTLTAQNEQLQATVTQQVSQIQQHKDQYNLLKVQLGRLQEEQPSPLASAKLCCGSQQAAEQVLQSRSSRQPSASSGLLLCVLQHLGVSHRDKLHFSPSDVLFVQAALLQMCLGRGGAEAGCLGAAGGGSLHFQVSPNCCCCSDSAEKETSHGVC